MDKHEMFEEDYHHYAYNDKGELVHLCIDKEPIQRGKYKCLACEHDVYPVEGEKKKRDWHFRHAVANPECNTESYLHQLAKRIIKEKFDNSDTFYISYQVKEVCPYYEKCKEHFDYCERTKLETFNLKEKYDTCIPEKKDSHLKYLPDLILSSKNNPRRKPLFIEIAYTHDCTDEKIKSGVKIVELKIFEESDILQPLVEDNSMLNYSSGNPYQFTDLQMVRFFNFDRIIKNKDIAKKCDKVVVFKAKKKLRKEFLKSDQFVVQYNGLKLCSNANNCSLASHVCNIKDIVKEDFKKIYNSCTDDYEDGIVFKNNDIEIPSTKIKFSFEKKGVYDDEGRVIELLHYSNINKKLSEDLMIDDFSNPSNPYKSVYTPSVRFYNFDRFTYNENTIKLKRFAIIKEDNSINHILLDDTDCQHIKVWPANIVYGLLVPKAIAVNVVNFKLYGMMKACLKGIKLYHCSLCRYCYRGQGGCVHMGFFMFDLLSKDDIDKEKECVNCDKYSINLDLIRQVIMNIKIPHVEWSDKEK